MNDLNEDLKAFAEFYQESDEAKRERLKEAIKPNVEKVKELQLKLADVELQAENISKEIKVIMEDIRKEWQPFITGVDKASIVFDNNLKLEAVATLTIGTEDADKAIDWFRSNGYESVMKWQIHDQTKKKIARDHYENKQEEIPGLTYSKFTVIKVK